MGFEKAVGKVLFTPARKAVVYGRRNSKFINSVFLDCRKSRNAFVKTRRAARANGDGYFVSVGKGIVDFAKTTGPVPFATSAFGFLCLPFGGTSIGLLSGTCAKQVFKTFHKLFS